MRLTGRWSALLLVLCCLSCAEGEKPPQEAAGASLETKRSYEFVGDVLRCVRLSLDTKDDESGIERAANDREKGFLFAERLEWSGRGIQSIMEPWQVAQEPRISEVADHLHAAGRDLVEMAASFREIVRGGDPDENSAAFKVHKEDLTGRWFSAAALVAHRDSTKRLVLTAEQKRAIVALIETELFGKEMAEFDQTPDDLKESYVTQPDLYAVIAFRNIYKRELKSH